MRERRLREIMANKTERGKGKIRELEGQMRGDHLEPGKAFSMKDDLAEGHNDCSQHLDTKSLANRLMRPEKTFTLLCAFIIQHIRHRAASCPSSMLYHAASHYTDAIPHT